MLSKAAKWVWRLFMLGILLIVLLFTLANFGVFGRMPTISEIQNPEADITSEYFTNDGRSMGKFFAENRREIKYSDLPTHMVQALIATEDERFYDHSGIDVEALGRTIKTLGQGGGASTISQQLAKLMLKQGRGNFFKRGIDKIKEWIVAVKIERNFTKEEIITLYLNRADWGYIYGIYNASKTFFKKEPKDLTLEESAVLIGMLKSPFNFNPVRKTANSAERRNVVIQQMVNCKHHYLTQAQADAYKAKPLITNYEKIEEKIGYAPYFRVALEQWMNKWCKSHKNPKTGEYYDLYTDGLKIYTTIDPRMQAYAEKSVESHVPGQQRGLNSLVGSAESLFKKHPATIRQAIVNSIRYKELKKDSVPEEKIMEIFNTPVKMKVFTWANQAHEKDTTITPIDSIKYMKKFLQASFAAMDPRTGAVKAWVGGIDFKYFKYDHITGKRQVGSTFKPLLYQLAVKELGYGPNTEIQGGSIRMDNKTITGGGGAMAHCLAMSKNAAAYRLIKILGPEKLIDFARKCGITDDLPPYASLALGSGEVPMLQMLRAYTMFPNRGVNVEPIFVDRIEDKNGNLIETIMPETREVVSQGDAFKMVKMMQGVIDHGTAKKLLKYNIPVQKAGKTGTTNGNADGWFIGYTPELLAGCWLGCDDPFIKIYAGTRGGAEMAAPMWGRFMASCYNDDKLGYGQIKKFEKPVILDSDPVFADNQYFENIINQSRQKYGDDDDDGDESVESIKRIDKFKQRAETERKDINLDEIKSDYEESTDPIKLNEDAIGPTGSDKQNNSQDPANPSPPKANPPDTLRIIRPK